MSASASLPANLNKPAETQTTIQVEGDGTQSVEADSSAPTNVPDTSDKAPAVIGEILEGWPPLPALVDYGSSEIGRDHKVLRERLETIEEKLPDLNIGDWSEVSAIRAELEAVDTSLQTLEDQLRGGGLELHNPKDAREAQRQLRQQLEALREQVAQRYDEAWQRLEAARRLSPEEVQRLEAERQRLEEARQQVEAERQRLAEECQHWEAERQQVEAERQRWAEERRQLEAARQRLEEERREAEAARKRMREERYQAGQAQRDAETELEQLEKERQRLESERRLAVDRSRPAQGRVQAGPSPQGCLPGWARWLKR